MSTYSKNSHLRELFIRKMIGSAMVADAAVSFGGIWNFSKLEYLIDGKKYPKSTGKYSHLHQGRLPHSSTCNKKKPIFCSNTTQYYDFCKWKNIPYWRLLYRVDPSFEDITNALLSIKYEIWDMIWESTPEQKNFDKVFSQKKISTSLISAIANYNNFEALLVLTAWSRQLRKSGNDYFQFQCIKEIRRIIAHVICNTPQIFIRWPIIIQYYIEPVWCLRDGQISHLLNIPHIEGEIHKEEIKARSNGVLLPPKHIFRQLNKNNFSSDSKVSRK